MNLKLDVCSTVQVMFGLSFMLTSMGLVLPDVVTHKLSKAASHASHIMIEENRSQLKTFIAGGAPAGRGGEQLPRSARVAVILRGEAFRSGVPQGPLGYMLSCDPKARSVQLNATTSVLEMIVLPLERRGNQVDIFATVNHCEDRDLLSEIVNIFGDRVVLVSIMSEAGQGKALHKALDQFVEIVGEKQVAGYKQVIVVRHDLLFGTPIDAWPVECHRINFASYCEISREKTCLNDVLQMMPGALFKNFTAQVGRAKCFNDMEQSEFRGTGHYCGKQLRRAVGKHRVGVAWPWQGEYSVQDSNEWGRITRG